MVYSVNFAKKASQKRCTKKGVANKAKKPLSSEATLKTSYGEFWYLLKCQSRFPKFLEFFLKLAPLDIDDVYYFDACTAGF